MRTRTSTSTTSVRESRTTIGAHRSPNECFVRSPCACVCFCVQFADIIIYDEEADKHVHIPFEKACAAAGLTGAAAIADGDERTAAMPGWCSSKAKTTAAINNSKSGTYQSGVCVVIVRPFIEHLMMSAVMTVAGRDTGATLFGPAGKPFSPHSCAFLVSTCTHTHTVLTRVSSSLPSCSQTCRSRPTPRSRPSRVRNQQRTQFLFSHNHRPPPAPIHSLDTFCCVVFRSLHVRKRHSL